ncbi:MAG: hypothetical protein WKG07_45800 [Hymenobacter sp.]
MRRGHRPDRGQRRHGSGSRGGDPAPTGRSTGASPSCPEDEAVPVQLTARELVRYVADLHGVRDPRAAEPGPGLVDMLPARRPSRSRASARACASGPRWPSALVTDPPVLVLDEPLNGADPVQRVRLTDLFRQLGAEGRTVIVSSHVLSEVERLAEPGPGADPRPPGRSRQPPGHPRRHGRPTRHVLIRSDDPRRLAAPPSSVSLRWPASA